MIIAVYRSIEEDEDLVVFYGDSVTPLIFIDDKGQYFLIGTRQVDFNGDVVEEHLLGRAFRSPVEEEPSSGMMA